MIYLSACCIFKNESKYLKEWVEYHLLIGCDHFYMISNDDNPNESLNILKPYIDRKIVEFLHRPGGPFVTLQTDIYLEVILLARGKTRWLAFLDIDEFLLPVQNNSVADVFKDYEQFAGVAVNWACFGSSGLLKAPEMQTESFNMRLPDEHDENRIYKSIVNPNHVIGVSNPHKFIFEEPYFLVDEFKNPVITHDWKNINDPFFGKRLRINHYRIRSKSEFSEKLARWKNNDHPDFHSPSEIEFYWQHIDDGNTFDDTIGRFLPKLKERLGVDSKITRMKNRLAQLFSLNRL